VNRLPSLFYFELFTNGQDCCPFYSSQEATKNAIPIRPKGLIGLPRKPPQIVIPDNITGFYRFVDFEL
jgi:hypothetical protein